MTIAKGDLQKPTESESYITVGYLSAIKFPKQDTHNRHQTDSGRIERVEHLGDAVRLSQRGCLVQRGARPNAAIQRTRMDPWAWS